MTRPSRTTLQQRLLASLAVLLARLLVALGLLSRTKKRRNAYYRAQWWF